MNQKSLLTAPKANVSHPYSGVDYQPFAVGAFIFSKMKGERVQFKVKGSCEIQIGRLVKDNLYKNKLKVIAADGKATYCISLLKMLKKF